MVAIFYMIVFMVIVRYRIDLGIILCVQNVWGFTTYVRSENQDDPAYEFFHRFWVILAMVFLIIGYIIISHPTASFVINDMLILALCVVILLFVPVFVSRVHHFWRDRDLVTRKNVRLFIRTMSKNDGAIHVIRIIAGLGCIGVWFAHMSNVALSLGICLLSGGIAELLPYRWRSFALCFRMIFLVSLLISSADVLIGGDRLW